MRVEASALERFAANFEHDTTVSFPQPYRDWTSEYVLTETLAIGNVSSLHIHINNNNIVTSLYCHNTEYVLTETLAQGNVSYYTFTVTTTLS
jgi:predicted unusual protein kinase regulating ubiquinone biosynthesis (AarF/ABC1/UbiB family)